MCVAKKISSKRREGSRRTRMFMLKVDDVRARGCVMCIEDCYRKK